MTAFESYQLFMALKFHFSSAKYDFFKYQGKTKGLSLKSFNTRKDKIFFLKLSKHIDPKGFLISNMLIKEKIWIGSLVYDEESEKIYKNWAKRNNALLYHFKDDIINLNLKKELKIENNNLPNIINLCLGKHLSLESTIILLSELNLMDRYSVKFGGHFVWGDFELKIRKYLPFMNYDKSKALEIIKYQIMINTCE